MFPIFLIIGYLTTISLYLILPVLDKEKKTKYLLNFAGMRVSAYYIGMFLADFIIFSLSNVLLVAFVFVLDLGIFTANAGNLFFILTVLGFPYITLGYLMGFMFQDTKTAYRCAFWVALLIYAVPLILTGHYMPKSWIGTIKTVCAIASPFYSLQEALA